jgi:hypothetical protein
MGYISVKVTGGERLLADAPDKNLYYTYKNITEKIRKMRATGSWYKRNSGEKAEEKELVKV